MPRIPDLGQARIPDSRQIPDPGSRSPSDAFAPSLDAYKYVGFEDQFRGSREVIRARLESYLPLFDGKARRARRRLRPRRVPRSPDARGISTARGIDLNHEMAEVAARAASTSPKPTPSAICRRLADASLGGIFSAQVVEHLQPGYLLRFLELAFHKLRPGGRMVLETLNPACWVAFFESYIRDITHVWPLHPETLKYLVVASGFTSAAIEFRSPVRRAGSAAADCRRRPAAQPALQRPRRSVQRQRREAERAHVHVPGLRGHRRQGALIHSRRQSISVLP